MFAAVWAGEIRSGVSNGIKHLVARIVGDGTLKSSFTFTTTLRHGVVKWFPLGLSLSAAPVSGPARPNQVKAA